jgi:hypothetical protein
MRASQRLAFLASAAALAIGASGAGSAAAKTFVYTGQIASWTVPQTGLYQVRAWGAQGGGATYPDFPAGAGGLGAEVGGDVRLHAGEVLIVVVGGVGTTSLAESANGGGGASWLFAPGASRPMVVAGGGGGEGWAGALDSGGPGQVTPQGQAGDGGGAGGGAGKGGRGGGMAGGGGGGGWLAVGGSSSAKFPLVATGGDGGPSFAGGRIRGDGAMAGDPGHVDLLTGGFGGGGGSGWSGGGGGGGYGGGGGGGATGGPGDGGGGGGGGSWLADGFSNIAEASGVRLGDGMVSIAGVTPEPATWGLMLIGVGGLGAVLRRRRAIHAR